MAVSRRFDSRFIVSFTKYIVETATLRTVTGLASGTTAQHAVPAIGVPSSGYAFQARYSAGWGAQAFVASNSAAGANGLSVYPATAVAWDDDTRGRVPNNVTWYDDNSTAVLTGSSASSTGRYSTTKTVGGRTVRYRMHLAFWHQVEIENNSEHPVTVFTRALTSHTFKTDGDFNAAVMSSWAGTEIAAGNSHLVTGYEPVEIKLDSNSTGRDLLGITIQDGSRHLLLF